VSNRRRLLLPNTREHREALREASRALILPAGVQRSGGKQLVRNMETGHVLPCCLGECMEDGDNRHRVEIPHSQPKWPGEMLVYIFCGPTHRSEYLKGTPYADK
jgi:hypothetical protein